MADQTDVETSLVNLLVGVAYPNGTSQAPGQGYPVLAMPGWPTPETVDATMATGKICCWVYSRPEVRETTRFPYQWQTQGITPATITATVSGNTVTIGGAMPSPFSAHNVFVLMGGQAFGYAVQASDTLSTIAATLASQINAVYAGTSSAGPVLTVGKGPLPIARVGTVGQSVLEIGRFEQQFQICIAASTPAARTALSAAVMPVLMATSWLTMPDGTAARLRVKSPVDVDSSQKVAVYRRDIRVAVEYAVTQTQSTATVEAVPTTFTGTYASAIPSRSF